MRLEFEVRDSLPPKKDGASSMWSKDSEFKRLVALQRAARCATPAAVVLRHRIHLRLDVHLPKPESKQAGDLDTFVTGVCDGLMRAPANVNAAENWSDASLAEIHPSKTIAIDDGSAVVEIVARKLVAPNGA